MEWAGSRLEVFEESGGGLEVSGGLKVLEVGSR